MNKTTMTARRKRGALLLAWAYATLAAQGVAGEAQEPPPSVPLTIVCSAPEGALGELVCYIAGDVSDSTTGGLTHEGI